MAENLSSSRKEKTPERLSRWARNWNAIGAVALGGLAIAIPGPNVILGTLAGINVAQAGGFELLRRHTSKTSKQK